MNDDDSTNLYQNKQVLCRYMHCSIIFRLKSLVLSFIPPYGVGFHSLSHFSLRVFSLVFKSNH